MDNKVTTCLTFQGNAEEALKFYTTVFPKAKIDRTDKVSAVVAKGTGAREGSVLAQTMKIGNFELLALNGPPFEPTPATSIFVACASAKEMEDYWAKLSSGGTVRMGLDKYPWSEKYGWTADKFGVEWQFILNPHGETKFGNCLLFTDEKFGQGPKALEFYLKVFESSKTLSVTKDEKTNSLMHAAIELDGQEFWIMDGAGTHGYAFSSATSYMVYCENQAEVDHYWNALLEGGKALQCGWLVDKFGVTWQIVPRRLRELTGDPKKSDRAMAAMMDMIKIDIAQLEAATR